MGLQTPSNPNSARRGRTRTGALEAKKSLAFAVVILVAMSSTGFGRPGASPDVALKAWMAYTQAQRQFQQELADFMLSRRPDLKELILVSRDLQLATIERRSLEFHYLLASHPERIVTNQGISKFSNYDWTDEDAKVLRRTNPDYEATIDRIKALKTSSDRDSHWAELRAANQALAKQADYQAIYDRFDRRTEAAGKLLK